MGGIPNIVVGAQIGPYVVEQQIGVGATAAVVLASHTNGRKVAIKVRARGAPAADRRFIREFERLRSMRLPGVVSVEEAGIDAQHVWFSMEYVDGPNFFDACSAVSPEDRYATAIRLGQRLLEALSHVHAAGLSHRDIKPPNVMIDKSGMLRLLDFGIGQTFEARDSGAVREGTLPYMAPEQMVGLPCGSAVDIYAAGLMLYEAVNGPRPSLKNPLAWIMNTCTKRLPALATLHRDVPLELSHLIDQMLSVNPNNRPSARDAKEALRRAGEGECWQNWPEPNFVEPGPYVNPLIDALSEPRTAPPVLMLNGRYGSGRRRIVEEIERNLLIDGGLTLHASCDVVNVGGPLGKTIEQLIAACRSDDEIRSIAGDDAPILQFVWPDLQLPPTTDRREVPPRTTEIVQAVIRTLQRAAAMINFVIVLHQFEQVDTMTGRVLDIVSTGQAPGVRFVLIHDARWATRRSEAKTRAIRGYGKNLIQEIPRLQPTEFAAIARTFTTIMPESKPVGGVPQRAVEKGLEALAQWRNDPWEPPDARLWPLAVHSPIPRNVLFALVGEQIASSMWVRESDAGFHLISETAARAARNRLADNATAARALADTWQRLDDRPIHAPTMARLRMLAGTPEAARPHVLKAAHEAASRGRYREARRWFLLHDTLPANEHAVAFSDLVTMAEVAFISSANRPRAELATIAMEFATSHQEQLDAQYIAAKYALRCGEVTSALAESLRLSTASPSNDPERVVRALLLATDCRIRLRQFDVAAQQISRAEAANSNNILLRTMVNIIKLRLLVAMQEVTQAEPLGRQLVSQTRELEHIHMESESTLLLSQTLRYLGRRGESEALVRRAIRLARTSGDLSLLAELELHLATLLAERGESVISMSMLDTVIRKFRRQNGDHHIPRALSVALDVARVQEEPSTAVVAIATLRGEPWKHHDAPSALVRWFTEQADLQSIRDIPSPAENLSVGSWGWIAWLIARAQAELRIGNPAMAGEFAQKARDHAEKRGFDELSMFASLIIAAVDDAPNEQWRALCRKGLRSVWTEVWTFALATDARRWEAQGDRQRAKKRWAILHARCEELGYLPGLALAAEHLARD